MTNAPAARPLLWPLVPLYRLGLALRQFQLRSGLKPIGACVARRQHWKSLHGGSGKTPLTIALAQALAARGIQVDVLSRGYGGGAPRTTLVDPNGSAEDFGDEPLSWRAKPVSRSTSRPNATKLAVGERSAPSGFGLHLLDDGFQHRQLARDIDILLLSRRDLAGHLLPAGNLREALHAAERAQVIAIPADEPELETEIESRGWRDGLAAAQTHGNSAC